MDKLSIIIPMFHGSHYITRLLKMINQNFSKCYEKIPLDVEVIFVNDSPEEKLDSNIRLDRVDINIIYNEENRGIHFSRVTGVKHSSGNIILFLDQDDLIDENYLYFQYLRLENNKICVCNGYDINGKNYKKFYKNKKSMERINKTESFGLWNEIISPGQCLIRREAIPDFWMKHILKNNGADDYFLWVLLLINGYHFSLNDKALFFHIRNGNNTSDDLELMGRSSLEANHYLKTYNDQAKKIAYENDRFVRTYLMHESKYFDVYFKLAMRKLYLWNIIK